MHSANYLLRHLNVMKTVHDGALGVTAPMADVPAGTLKVGLRGHQQAVLAAMEARERTLLTGLDVSGETFFSNYGVIGDSVGVGKSLMVLGHIARLQTIPPLTEYTSMGKNSSTGTFSLRREKFTDASEAGCLIVVPHTLFRQWADYIKKQTSLRALLLEKKKALDVERFQQDVMEAQIVLVSNTLYKQFSRWVEDREIRWKRAFFFFFFTCHIVSGYPRPKARFTWLVTASWMNILFPNDTLYVGTQLLNQVVFNPNSVYSCLRPQFQDILNTGRVYNYLRYYVTSYNFFRDLLSNDHSLRGHLVIRCTDEFIKQSISLPTLMRRNILCKAPLNQQIIREAVPHEVKNLLDGGDVTGAIQALGVKTEECTSLIDAVTKNLQKELKRHKDTYSFKSNLEYATPKAKEEALKTLEEKIKRTETAIKSLHDRIAGFQSEMCPVCYDEPGGTALVTPCCSQIFCGQCILTCLSRAPTCPMCRTGISAKNLVKVVVEKEKNEIVTNGEAEPKEELEKKSEALYRLFRENPGGRFLVFSRYDNPFSEMETKITDLGVRVKQLKGNKDAIAATLRAFQGGDLRCLLLNAHYAGSGLNITAASHVILFHAMTHEEEKQILGRAYRLGRTEPLQFIRLLHQDEMPTSS